MKMFFRKNKGWVLVGALLLFAAVLLFAAGRKNGKTLVIMQDGKEIYRGILQEGFTYRVETETGYNVFTVVSTEQGELGVCCREADCPEQICVEKGTVILANDPVVCLPHRVTAVIVSGE